jgi:hypothetical protein
MFDRSLAVVAGFVVLVSGLGIGLLPAAFMHNNIELFGAMIAWYSLTLGCGALLMSQRGR